VRFYYDAKHSLEFKFLLKEFETRRKNGRSNWQYSLKAAHQVGAALFPPAHADTNSSHSKAAVLELPLDDVSYLSFCNQPGHTARLFDMPISTAFFKPELLDHHVNNSNGSIGHSKVYMTAPRPVSVLQAQHWARVRRQDDSDRSDSNSEGDSDSDSGGDSVDGNRNNKRPKHGHQSAGGSDPVVSLGRHFQPNPHHFHHHYQHYKQSYRLHPNATHSERVFHYHPELYMHNPHPAADHHPPHQHAENQARSGVPQQSASGVTRVTVKRLTTKGRMKPTHPPANAGGHNAASAVVVATGGTNALSNAAVEGERAVENASASSSEINAIDIGSESQNANDKGDDDNEEERESKPLGEVVGDGEDDATKISSVRDTLPEDKVSSDDDSSDSDGASGDGDAVMDCEVDKVELPEGGNDGDGRNSENVAATQDSNRDDDDIDVMNVMIIPEEAVGEDENAS